MSDLYYIKSEDLGKWTIDHRGSTAGVGFFLTWEMIRDHIHNSDPDLLREDEFIIKVAVEETGIQVYLERKAS